MLYILSQESYISNLKLIWSGVSSEKMFEEIANNDGENMMPETALSQQLIV